MIVVFPMLTDESVSQNTLPGICKALEKFILIYELDAIMKITGWTVLAVGSKIAGQMATKTKYRKEDLMFEISEAKALPGAKKKEEDTIPEELLDTEEKKRSKTRRSSGDPRKKPQPGEQLFDALGNLKDIGTVKVDLPKDQALSVEPTFMMVTTTLGTRIIGVKVIPVPVKSSKYSLAELLVMDAALRPMDALVYKISRKAIRGFWALCRFLRLPFLSDQIISGDPEKDILWAQSFHKRYVFCLLNYADFSDSNFFKHAGGIHKLHSVGWNSFVVADDVNKRAIFCMKEFHGLCSSVSYQFIYSSLGKEHAKVYDDLEDLKKSASPFFRSSVNQKRLFSEAQQEAFKVIDKYLKRIV